MALINIEFPDAELYYNSNFLPSDEATQLFHSLLTECTWQRRTGSFGHPVPRDEAYYGDSGTDYQYSRREYQPLPWIPELLTLKARIEQAVPEAAYNNCGLSIRGFNACLANRYCDGQDSVGLHADNEPEMGPVIASVSLMAAPDASRLFLLRRHDGSIAWSQRLTHGSLLIMAGDTQKNLKHEIPKERRLSHTRINLTFRHIEHK